MIEVARQIRVDYLPMMRVQQCGDLRNSVQRTAIRAIGVLFRLQIGLEDRFENQHCRRHHDTIFNRRDSHRELHMFAALIWDRLLSRIHIILCAVSIFLCLSGVTSVALRRSFSVAQAAELSRCR